MTQAVSDIVVVCHVADLAVGQMRQFQLPGRDPIAVYNVAGEFFATDDLCTHGQASLSLEGLLDDYVVECSWHLGAFDVRNGEPVAPPCQVPLRAYPVVIDGENVCIVIERKATQSG